MLRAVVVNYRTAGDLAEFLQSWAECAGEVEATLIIANVCPLQADDEAAEVGLRAIELAIRRTRRMSRPSTFIWDYDTNVGYNLAVNEALERGSSPYLAAFNADVVLKPGVLKGCVDALAEHPDWAVVGPRQVDEQNRITCAGTFGTPEAPHMRGWMQNDAGQFSDTRDDCVHVSGSAMFWRRSVWDELTACPLFQEADPGAVGALLGALHFWGESFAMLHARAHGYSVAFDGRVTAIHKWHRSSPVGQAPHVAEDQAFFRKACDIHAIAHD